MHKHSSYSVDKRRFWTAANTFVIAAILNFVAFLAISLYLGGDAVNGKVEAGHYYLFGLRAKPWQKGYTEVSESVFNYSRWHVYSLWITWLPVMAILGIQHLGRKGAREN